MVFPCNITIVIPLKINIPARVTINAGTFTYAIQKPCQAPINAPMQSDIIIAIGIDIPIDIISTPDIADTTATIDPTDKSIFPVKTQGNIPIANTKT